MMKSRLLESIGGVDEELLEQAETARYSRRKTVFKVLLVAAMGVGLFFVLVFMLIIRQVMKLSTDKTFQMEETLGQIADTYLRIPGNKQGVGKVMVSVRGSLHELEAMTEGETIPTGTKVRVTKVIGSELLEVERV